MGEEKNAATIFWHVTGRKKKKEEERAGGKGKKGEVERNLFLRERKKKKGRGSQGEKKGG